MTAMSTIAIVTMLSAWLVIGTFTIRFFIKVLATPQEKDGEVN
jgi:hypothetical protein